MPVSGTKNPEPTAVLNLNPEAAILHRAAVLYDSLELDQKAFPKSL